MNHRHNLSIIVFVLCICSLVACSTNTSPAPSHATASVTTPKVQPTPTKPAIAPGTVLYQANWLQGLAGWKSSGGWQVVQGQLQADSLSLTTITAPYISPVANYAIEARIQVVRLLQKNGGSFSLFASPRPGKPGYEAGVARLMGPGPRPNGSNPQLQIFLDPLSAQGSGPFYTSDYDPRTLWHTFRIEVQGSEVRLIVDGAPTGSATSQQTDFLSNGPFGIESSMVVLRVSSFRVIAL